MIIKDIQDINTRETRTDGRYPARIGCEVEYLRPVIVGDCAYLGYLKDNQGNEKGGYLRTSIVTGCSVMQDQDIIFTNNSIYVLSKV